MDMLERVGPLRPELLLSLLCQIMDGLAFLHGQRVVHRDIKPHNILLTHVCISPVYYGSDPPPWDLLCDACLQDGMAKLADFGCSALIDNTKTYAN